MKRLRLRLTAALLAVLSLAMLLLTGCGGKSASDLAAIQKKGTLVVGITEYAPMDYRDENGEWTGFDAELARLVGEKLGVSVEFLEITWDNKYFELNSGAIDCIWNGMTLSEEVTNNADASIPYVKNAQVLVMPGEEAGAYKTAESLQGKTLAVEAGSAGEAAAKALGLSILAVESQSAALMEAAAGTADGCVVDLTMANAMTGAGSAYPALEKGWELTSEVYAVGFRKGSDVTARVNASLTELREDGTLTALAEKYDLALAE